MRPASGLREVVGWPRLLCAVGISVTGDQLSSIAVAAYLLAHGSPAWVAAYYFVAIGIRLVAGSNAGKLADRHNRQRLLVLADVGRATIMTALAGVIWADGSPIVVIALIGLSNLLATIYRPAFAAWLPNLVPAELLPNANSAEAAMHQVGWILGPAIGAAMAATFSTSVAVLANAATFGVAAVITAGVKVQSNPIDPSQTAPDSAVAQPADATDAPDPGVDADVANEFLFSQRDVLAVTAAVMLAFGAELVLHFVLAERVYGMGAAGAGYLTAAAGIGGLIGSVGASNAYHRYGVRWTLVGSVIVGGVFTATLGVVPLVGALALIAAKGALDMFFEVALCSHIQSSVPDSELGATFGRLDALGAGAQLGGVTATPILLNLTSPATAVAVFGLAASLVAATVWVRTTPAGVLA